MNSPASTTSAAPSTGKASAAPRTQPVEACPLCGSPAKTKLFAIPDRLHGTPGEFAYSRCGFCRTVFQDPRVIDEDLPLCYPGDYYTHAAPPAVAEVELPTRHLPGARDTIRNGIIGVVQGQPEPGLAGGLGRVLAGMRRMRERAFYDHVIDELIPPRQGHLRALDIGCGSGKLMVALVRAGWDVEGVEWDPHAAEVARRTSGRPVQEGDFRRLDLPQGAFDLVVLSHVFEHLDDPVGGLRRLRELLAPGGRLVLFYPNPESLEARLFGDAWFPWDPPRHLVLPPGDAVAQAARRVGLKPVRVRTRGHHAAEYSALSTSYRNGQPVRLDRRPDLSRRDKLCAVVERGLTGVGLLAGEELVVTLQRDD